MYICQPYTLNLFFMMVEILENYLFQFTSSQKSYDGKYIIPVLFFKKVC